MKFVIVPKWSNFSAHIPVIMPIDESISEPMNIRDRDLIVYFEDTIDLLTIERHDILFNLKFKDNTQKVYFFNDAS